MASSSAKISPFAPKSMPTPGAIDGVRFASCEAGIRYKNRTDLMMAVLAPGTVAAGVLTKSKTCSAPVLWCRDGLAHGRARGLVVNSGNANAFTGMKGQQAVRTTAGAAAAALGCAPEEVFLASTGVIGEPMDADKFAHRLVDLAKSATGENWQQAARAIMTTDTFAKLVTRTVDLGGGKSVQITGFCKGAGMIAPDMATMLCFVFTDAKIDRGVLQGLVAAAADRTFNCITVDGDTSTSDTVLVFATGKAAERGVAVIDSTASREYSAFKAGFDALMLELALLVVKDGEGVTKFVQIDVEGAESDMAARRIGMSIANSPLVKTAFAGEDPNWGRVVMAVGKSGEAADRDRLSIWFGPHLVANEGQRAASYDEKTVAGYMKNGELSVRVDIGIGSGKATVWTCDLSHDYVSINADYRS